MVSAYEMNRLLHKLPNLNENVNRVHEEIEIPRTYVDTQKIRWPKLTSFNRVTIKTCKLCSIIFNFYCSLVVSGALIKIIVNLYHVMFVAQVWFFLFYLIIVVVCRCWRTHNNLKYKAARSHKSEFLID